MSLQPQNWGGVALRRPFEFFKQCISTKAMIFNCETLQHRPTMLASCYRKELRRHGERACREIERISTRA